MLIPRNLPELEPRNLPELEPRSLLQLFGEQCENNARTFWCEETMQAELVKSSANGTFFHIQY